jgi:formate hydrogenlyase transcriptional activator
MQTETKNIPTEFETSQDSENLLSLIALFDGQFSIDWLVELTGCKVSHLINTLEESVSKGELIQKGSGFYRHSDSADKCELKEKLTQGEKKRYHCQISNLLLRELPDDENKPLQVSHHLLYIDNEPEYCQYLTQAGDCNQKRYETQKAFECYAKALEDLGRFSGKEIDHLFAETAIKYSKISTGRRDTSQVLDTLKEAVVRAKKWNFKSFEGLLEMHIAKNEWLMAKYTSAMNHFNKGWSIANQLNDLKLRYSAMTFSTFFLYWQGRFKEAVHVYETSVPDVEKFPHGRFPLLAAMTVGYCYSQIGQVTQGLGTMDAIRATALEKGNLNIAAYTSGNMGNIMLDINQVDEAIPYLKKSVKEAKEANNEWVLITGYLLLAYAFYQIGQEKKCTNFLRDFLKQRQRMHLGVTLYSYMLELFYAMEQERIPRIRGDSLESEVKRLIRSKNIFMKGVAYRYQALLQRNKGVPPKKIIHTLKKSLKWLQESGHLFETAETCFELARQHVLLGDKNSARELMMDISKQLSSYSDIKVPDDLRHLMDDSPINEHLLKEILKLGQKVADVANNKDLVKQVLSDVNRMTGAERGALFLLDDRSGIRKFRLRASKNLTAAQVNHPNFSSSLKLLEEVAKTGQGRIKSADFSDETAFFADESIRSRICVPMLLRGKVIGVLYHDNRLLSSAFNQSDLELLGYFAAQAAFALDNARAYNEIKQLNQRLREEKEYYQEQHVKTIKSDEIIGESTGIKNILTQISQVAQTEATALILGDTGVGKELVARAIHNQSFRKDKPFIRVHCSALPENLITSELFGHEKGAFTGATNRRIGRFELANTGTLFLDEIGDIPPDIQVRLLRVLQTREFERVGGSKTIQSDFRLVVATNKDLEAEVKANRFRADLFYRLNVFPLYVPLLKDRKEDIPLLVKHFLEIYASKMRKSFNRISDEEMAKLTHYDWPGNVRELENVIERGTILSQGPYFQAPELKDNQKSDVSYSQKLSLREVEKRHIEWALKTTGGKIRGPGGAAELLEIHPSTLHFRMKKLGITK